MGNNYEIIKIMIEDGIQTKAFDSNNVIHKDAFKRVKDLINQNLEKARNYNPKEKKDFVRVHNTITINGERGAGKTSFMLSIKKECEEKNNEIEVLDILDPTLISTKQHVFVLLISMIEEKVNQIYNNKCREKKYDDKYKQWKESLEELAKGLNQLDGVGTNPYAQDLWDDSALVMAKGLSLAKAGRDLEWKFHKFVNESLKILNKKAFLLFIDDIDTDFSKGWDVLEVLRKYITTPQIIPIMAGNFELYENLVRNEKSKLFKNLVNFEKNFDSFENKKILYNNQIDELTQQYLIKVMQPINMINLHRLYVYLFSLKYKVKINNYKDFDKFIKKVYEYFFIRYYYNEYSFSLLNLPLRLILQWLYKAYEIMNNNYKNHEYAKKEFLEYLKDLFILDLIKSFKGIDFNFFDNLNSEYNIDIFIRFLLDNNFSYEDIIEFKPINKNNYFNTSFIVLSQYFNAHTTFYQKIEWVIKGMLFFWIKNYFIEKVSYPEKNLLLIDIIKYYNKQKFSKNIKAIKLYYLSVIIYANTSKIKNNEVIKNLIQLIFMNKFNVKVITQIEKVLHDNKKLVNTINSISSKNKINEEDFNNFSNEISKKLIEILEKNNIDNIKYENIKELFKENYLKFINIFIALDFAINQNQNQNIFINFTSKIISEIIEKKVNLKRQDKKEKFLKEVLDSEEGKQFVSIVKKILIEYNIIEGLEDLNDSIYKKLPLIKYKTSMTTKNAQYIFSFLKLLSLFKDIIQLWDLKSDKNTFKLNLKQIIKNYIDENNITIITNIEETEDDTEDNELISENEEEINKLIEKIIQWIEKYDYFIKSLSKCHLLDINKIFKDFYETFEKKISAYIRFLNASMYIKTTLYSLLNSIIKLFIKDTRNYIPDIYKFDQLDYLNQNINKIQNKREKEYISNFKKFILECPIFEPYIKNENDFEKVLVSYNQ